MKMEDRETFHSKKVRHPQGSDHLKKLKNPSVLIGTSTGVFCLSPMFCTWSLKDAERFWSTKCDFQFIILFNRKKKPSLEYMKSNIKH